MENLFEIEVKSEFFNEKQKKIIEEELTEYIKPYQQELFNRLMKSAVELTVKGKIKP